MNKTRAASAQASVAPRQLTRRYATYIFWLLWLANFINYADRYAFLAIGDHVQVEFKLSDTEYGLLATSFLFVYTLCILPMGLLADRIKRKSVVAGGITLWSIVTTFTALSPNYGVIFATRAALGLGEGSYFPASTSMLASAYPLKDRAKVMARWNTGLLAGLAVGFVGAGILYSVFNDQWRPVFYVFGVPGLLLALFIFLSKEPPRLAEDDDASAEIALARGGLSGVWRNIVELWRIPTLRVVVAMQALSFFIFGVALVFIVPLFDRQFHNLAVTPTTLVGVATVVGGITGLLVGGAVADALIPRYPGARVLVSGWSFLISLPFFIGSVIPLVFGLGLSANVRVFGIFTPLFIITVALLQVNTGPLTAVAEDVVTPLKRAASVGLTLLLSHFFGDLFAPTIAGALSDFFSGNTFFHSLGITHNNAPGYAFLIIGTPVLLAAGLVGVWGARFTQADEAAARAGAGK
ncbi:MAG TPA: MFS transporter [Ktedonobacterales bacterium]|nr:MFS transporter [Ktedonobacterales bacterium]